MSTIFVAYVDDIDPDVILILVSGHTGASVVSFTVKCVIGLSPSFLVEGLMINSISVDDFTLDRTDWGGYGIAASLNDICNARIIARMATRKQFGRLLAVILAILNVALRVIRVDYLHVN